MREGEIVVFLEHESTKEFLRVVRPTSFEKVRIEAGRCYVDRLECYKDILIPSTNPKYVMDIDHQKFRTLDVLSISLDEVNELKNQNLLLMEKDFKIVFYLPTSSQIVKFPEKRIFLMEPQACEAVEEFIRVTSGLPTNSALSSDLALGKSDQSLPKRFQKMDGKDFLRTCMTLKSKRWSFKFPTYRIDNPSF